MAMIELIPFRRLAIVLVAMLTACAAGQAPQSGALPEMPLLQRPIDLPKSGRLLTLDPERSSVRIHVFRAGRAAQLGHNHLLTAPKMSGLVWLPGPGLTGAGFSLELRLDELAVDPAAQRAAIGPGWDSAISAESAAATRLNMLGEANLQAARFPFLRIRSLQVIGELPKVAARIEVELHGQRQALWVPLQILLSAEALKASGAMVLRQSDFGITPFSLLGGLLAVHDELLIEFDLGAFQQR
jgi:hypothetical protein